MSPSSECQQGSSYCLFRATFSALLCFLWVILLFRVAPKCHAEVLSSFRKAGMCFTEKTVLHALASGLSYSAGGPVRVA